MVKDLPLKKKERLEIKKGQTIYRERPYIALGVYCVRSTSTKRLFWSAKMELENLAGFGTATLQG